MKTVLMVAEKPSLAASLASILSNRSNSTRKGSNGVCSVHEWNGKFRGVSVRCKMTSVCGHVMGVDFIGKFNNWDKVDPVELFSCPIERKEATPKLRMPHFLSQEARGCDYLVLWLDCDKEGENICFEVMDAVAHSFRDNIKSPHVTFRAKFSAITDKDIRYAFDNLVYPNENEAKSVDARQELDLRIGCAFTRFQTKFFQGKYGDLDATLISYGPCQTPTLGFCVHRHDQIQSFKPEPFWSIRVTLNLKENVEVNADWNRVRCFDKDVTQMFMSLIKDEKTANVMEITTKEKTKSRPQALNTVELMRVASSSLGMGPHHAMQLAERLYVQGFISYPRTETTKYPENFDLMGVLRQQRNSSEWGDIVQEILNKGINRPKQGHDAGDHPPITPMRLASRNELDSDHWRLYEYIARHFIGTLSADCKYMSTTISFAIKEEIFSISGKSVIDPGFTKVMPWQALDRNESSLPTNLRAGDTVAVYQIKMTDHQTSPPDYLTESELITLMEKHGIGTDASIPVHINNICQRNYVTVVSGRKLKPTTLGIVLVHGYQKIDAELVLPTMRSAVEQQLNLIALGKANFAAVLKHTVDIFLLKFNYFVQNIEAMDQLFEVSFSPLSESGKAFSRCGKCRRYMKYIQLKPMRLHCVNCDETYKLPQEGTVRLFKEQKCPLDEFELLSCTTGTKGNGYIFCPYCYNHPPFSEMIKGSGCNLCPHPTCSFSLTATGVCNCVNCDVGVLVLDLSSQPKWKLCCFSCNTIVSLFDGAQSLQVLADEVCVQCGAQHVRVIYKPEKSKFQDGVTEKSGCIFCTVELSKLVDRPKAAVRSRPQANRVYRGGSRQQNKAAAAGGGGRGRGRGRDHGRPKDKMAQLAAYFV